MGAVKHILLTGATGFVGKHLLKKLLENDFKVIALVRKTSNLSSIEQENVIIKFIEDDISNIFSNQKIDGIVHTATTYGQNGLLSDVLETNILFPIRLLEEAIKNDVKFFINTDTFFTKSNSGYSYLNNYTVSKKLLTEFSEQFAAKVVIVNFKLEHVYGENDGANKFITQFINRLNENELEINLTEGLQKRDFIYIDDVIEAYLAVLFNIDKFQGFIEIEVGTGNPISIRDAVTIIHSCTKSISKLNFGAISMRDGEFKESKANNVILKQLGWLPNYNFKEGITRILNKKN